MNNNKDDNLKPQEEKLSGGRVTQAVLKIGDTIRRPVGEHSQFVHRLLEYLEKNNFDPAPRYLGIDELGREILSYIPGEVPSDLDEWSDSIRKHAAKLIRCFHDITRGSQLAGQAEVVCHNDLSPCNFVFQNNMPVAIIDFDAAAPGSAISDLAYALWMWCNLGEEDKDPEEQGRCILSMCDAYGLKEKDNVIANILQIQKANIMNYQKNVDRGLKQWQGAVVWGKECLSWVLRNQNTLEKMLSQ